MFDILIGLLIRLLFLCDVAQPSLLTFTQNLGELCAAFIVQP
jgi:hypothetical protein